MNKYVIFSREKTNNDFYPMFWVSSILNWGDLKDATIFNEEDKENIGKQTPDDGVWVMLPVIV